MKLKRSDHNRFIQRLDRAAEKNPLMWLPCVLLITLALAGEYIAEYAKIVYLHRNTEKVVKKRPQIERKPFALRFVAMSLTVALSFIFVPNLNNIVGTNVYAYVTYGDLYLTRGIDYYEVVMCTTGANIVLIPAEINGIPIDRITGFDTSYGYSGAFQNTFVTKVVIPDSVYEIGHNSFKNCSYLESVNIPDTANIRGWISSEAFKGCTSLPAITIPSSIQRIYESAFENCTSLTDVVFPNEVDTVWSGHYIDSRCFAGCTSLVNINLPVLKADNPQEIGIMNNTFENCTSLTEITIPDGYVYINEEAFLNCNSLNKITIPKSVTSIGKDVFAGCNNLTIYGYSNTTAEEYAIANNIPFYSIGTEVIELTIEEQLRKNITNNYPDKDILYFNYGDFCYNDINSAFAIVGNNDTVNDISNDMTAIYVTMNDVTPLIENSNFLINNTSVARMGNCAIFIVEQYFGGSGSTSHAWVTENNNSVKKLEYTSSGLQYFADKDFYIHPSAFDSSIDGTGHTWKRYYLYWNGTGFSEYGGIEITEEQFSYADGDSYLEKIRADGYTVDNIIYRANGIVNVNYHNSTNNENMTLLLNNGKLSQLNLDSNNGSYGGIYQRAYFSEIATYPNEWPVQKPSETKKSFEIGKDNFSFNNSVNNFYDNKDFWGNYEVGRRNISLKSMLKLLNSTQNNTVKQEIIDYQKTNWNGSCFGMSEIMFIDFMDNSRLSKLRTDNRASSLHDLRTPIESAYVEDVITYYHLSQVLPYFKNTRNKFPYAVYENYSSELNQLLNHLNNGILLVDICDLNIEKKQTEGNHTILLLDIENESNQYYYVKCYDPNYSEEYTYMKIYKTQQFSSYGLNIEYNYNYNYNYDSLMSYYYNVFDVDQNNYYLTSTGSDETYDSNILILSKDKLWNAILCYNDVANILNNDWLIQQGLVSYASSESDGFFENREYDRISYYIDKNLSDKFTLVIDDNGGEGNAKLVLDNYSFSLTASNSLELNVSDISGSVQILSDTPSDFNLQLTSNDNFGGWKWFTVDVNVDDSTTFELAPIDEGIVVSGDNLSDITINANDEIDTTSIHFSTSEESVLVKNSDKNELEIYADTDDNGTYETLITDNNGVAYSISIPQNVSVKKGDSSVSNNDVLYAGDTIVITADDIQGLKLRSLKANGVEIANGDSYTVGNENVVITVEYTEITNTPIYDPSINPYSSKNIGQHDYINGFRSAQAINSYLTEKPGNTIERVEYIANTGVVIENYFKDGKTISQKVISAELPRFGGFFSGNKYNFLVFGQDNLDLNDNAEVLRIVKYTKNWKRLDAFSFKASDSKGYCGLDKAETKDVFSFGTLRMAESGDNLIVHTCHGMFNGHQSNMPFIINQSDMTFVKFAGYYTSHSFNQFVKTDPNFIYYVDHGDAYPRSIVLGKLPVDLNSSVGSDREEVFKIFGKYDIYGNETGVSVGDFELSGTGTIIVGNSVPHNDQSTYDPYGQRNIFLITTGNKFSDFSTKWITNYSKGVEIGNPYLIKLNGSRFAIMWEETLSKGQTTIKYLTVDDGGNILIPAVSINARLSDCQPILTTENNIMWYYTNNSFPIFVTIDLNGNVINNEIDIPSHMHSFSNNWNKDSTYHWHECTICGEHSDTARHIENNGTITVQPTATTSGTRTYYCSVCGYAVRTETIPPTGDPNPPYPINPTPSYPTVTYPTNTTVPTASEPYIYGNTSKSGWNVIISEIDLAPDGSTVKVNMNGTTELPKEVVSHIQNRNINLELSMSSVVWIINGLDVTKPKTVNMRVSDRYEKIPNSVMDNLHSELTAKQLRLYHSGDFGFKATLTLSVGKKYNNYYAALYHYNTKTKQLEFVDESLVAYNQVTFELTHASYYAVAFNSVPMYDDISSGAGVFEGSIPIETSAMPETNGVTIPAIKLPQIMKYSNKKRRYRILKKRRLDDLVFVM